MEKIMITLEEYVKKIKNYLSNKPELITGNERADFYLEIEENYFYNKKEYDELTEEEKEQERFVDEIRDKICERVEPFMDCKEEDEMLLAVMKKYGYM